MTIIKNDKYLDKLLAERAKITIIDKMIVTHLKGMKVPIEDIVLLLMSLNGWENDE